MESKQEQKRRLAEYIILFMILAAIFVAVVSFFVLKPKNKLLSAKIVRQTDIEADGGLFYQSVEAQILDTNKFINLKIPVKDLKLEQIQEDQHIYVIENESATVESYLFVGHQRSQSLLWLIVIFFILLVVVLGKQGLKYIIPTAVVFLLLISNFFTFFLNSGNIYILMIILIISVGFLGILINSQNIKIAGIVSVSQLLTLTLILFLNMILFKLTFLSELYYTDVKLLTSSVPFIDYWRILNAGALMCVFGATLNTSLDVAKSIMERKQKYPTSTTLSLIKEGSSTGQIATARVINTMFFLFIGAVLSHILLTDEVSGVIFWDDPRVVHFMILFINSGLAALFTGPLTAIVSGIFINSHETKKQLRLKLSNN